VDTLFRFVSASVFTINNNDQARVEAFMVAAPTDLAPIVGQQITLTDTNSVVAVPRIDLMNARCSTGFDSKVLFDLNGGAVNECDLIAKHNDGTEQSGYLLDPSSGDFIPDDGTADISDAALKALAAAPNNAVTYTAVPPGSGYRMGLNRDLDLFDDGLDNCPGIPNDPQTDTDSDGIGDPCDPTPIPEPGAVLQLVSGLFGLAFLDRRRRRRS
jgi:hypothetical protein